MSRNFKFEKNIWDVILIEDSDIPLETNKQRPCVIVGYDEDTDEYEIVSLSSQSHAFGNIDKVQLSMGSYITIPLQTYWLPSIVIKYAHKINELDSYDVEIFNDNLR